VYAAVVRILAIDKREILLAQSICVGKGDLQCFGTVVKRLVDLFVLRLVMNQIE